jgi:hypothetical protein
MTASRRVWKKYTVRDVDMKMKAVTSMTDLPESEILQEGIVEVLEEWGCTLT